MKHRALLFVSVFGLLACKTPSPRPMCLAETLTPDNPEVQAKQLEATTWFEVMLPGFDPTTSEVPRPVLDCMRRPLDRVAEVPDGCAELDDPARAQPVGPLTADDLVLAAGPDDLQLVWITVERYDDGEGSGPMAMIEWTDRGVAVRALGPIRTSTHGAQFKLEALGEGGPRVLLAEGERCQAIPACNEGETCDPPTVAGDDCRAVIRVYPLVGETFMATPLTDSEGRCVGPARFDKQRRESEELDDGWVRRFELTTSIELGEGELVVQEKVVIDEIDPSVEEPTPRPFREAEEVRRIRVKDGRLVTDRPSLWSRMRVLAGDVDREGSQLPAQPQGVEIVPGAGGGPEQRPTTPPGERPPSTPAGRTREQRPDPAPDTE